MDKPNEGRSRVVIENVQPQINCGLFPLKRIIGDLVSIQADVFGDGHDHVRARLLWKEEGATSWESTEMVALGNDRWQGEFRVDKIGRYRYTLVGEVDHFETWQSELKKRVEAGQDLAVPFATGAALLEQVQPRASKQDSTKLAGWAKKLRAAGNKDEAAVALALEDELLATVHRYPDATFETWYERELEIIVDRERAGFSAWYELFPRSWSPTPGKHGTLQDVANRLEYVAEMGFDVLYLAPYFSYRAQLPQRQEQLGGSRPGRRG